MFLAIVQGKTVVQKIKGLSLIFITFSHIFVDFFLLSPPPELFDQSIRTGLKSDFQKVSLPENLSQGKLANRRKRHDQQTGRIAVADSVSADLLGDNSRREVHSNIGEDITRYFRRRICSF